MKTLANPTKPIAVDSLLNQLRSLADHILVLLLFLI